ncbi:MAG: phytoene/squalene synthase family protein [Planctomycetota bacterium]|nr:phytoene/squalene synthase family protein [Planctomycetota bacterium]
MAQATARSPDAHTLEDSFRHCIEVTREQAKNFHFAFQVLPPERYRGICALYAFARLADDYSDDETDPQRALANAAKLRGWLQRALDGSPDAHAILPAVADTVTRFKVNPEYLFELIAGTEMDATRRRYATWDETYRYCYLVASVIGLMTIHVFGFRDESGEALKLAESTGIAFQLTNILRDVKEDALERDRIYLPAEDLARFGVPEAQVRQGGDSPAFRELVKFEVARARGYYEAGAKLVSLMEPDGRRALDVLVKIYRRLLEEIERRDYDVLSSRVSLSKLEKMRLAGSFALNSLLKK